MQGNMFNASLRPAPHLGQRELLQPAVDHPQDPRMRFRTVTSLLSLLQRALHIKVDEQHMRPSPWSPKWNRHQRAQLRAMAALATLFVRRDEITAVVGSPERVMVAYNSPYSSVSESIASDSLSPHQRAMAAQGARDVDMEDPSQIPIPNADELTEAKVLTYLAEVGANQQFDDHAKFIMQFVNQYRSSASDPMAEGLLTRQFTTYVIGSSALKMLHRISHEKYSWPYFNEIVGLPTGDMEWVGERASPPNWFDIQFIRALHSDLGVRYLRRVHRNIGQSSADPHWKRLMKELPTGGAGDQLLFPHLWNLTPKSKALYTKATHREFHQILCILLLGYRDSLKRLVGLKEPTEGELRETIDAVRDCLAILHPIAYSAAIVDHLSVVTNTNSRREGREPPPASVAVPSGEADDRKEIGRRLGAGTLEDSADMDVEEAPYRHGSPVDAPHLRWLKLQVAYFSASNHVISLFQSNTRLPNPIEVTISPTRCTGTTMTPLMPVLEDIMQNHPLYLATTNGPTDYELVKGALEMMVSSEGVDLSFGHTLDRMRQGSGFDGRIHCEAALAALLFGPTASNPSMYNKTIGVSQPCCPVCSAVLEMLSPYQPINILGSHRTVMPCALPDNLPSEVVDHILHQFEGQLAVVLRDMYHLSQLERSRKGFPSDGTANSHQLPPGDEPEIAMSIYDNCP